MESSFSIKMFMKFADIITLLAVSFFNLSTFSVGSTIFIMLVSTELDKSVHQPCIWHYHQHCTLNILFQLLSQSCLVINGTVTIIVANHVY